MIAALFVETNGAYFNLPDVDPWDERRDARLYAGPHPVVAHPPCSRWCRLAGLVEARWGHKRGDDGGCFASALESVRRYGGVLEHPAFTDAFVAYGIPPPETRRLAAHDRRRVDLPRRTGTLRPPGEKGDVALCLRHKAAAISALGSDRRWRVGSAGQLRQQVSQAVRVVVREPREGARPRNGWARMERSTARRIRYATTPEQQSRVGNSARVSRNPDRYGAVRVEGRGAP